jgi:AcrR family transcriptional regulator
MKKAQASRRSQIERTAETQSVLIQAAVRLLASAGYGKTTTQSIAREAGVTTGALHHHFPTKDDLMLAVLDQSAITVEEKLEAENAFPFAGKASIRDVVDHLWQIYGQPDYWAVWEIIIGTRIDTDVHQRVLAHRAQSMANVVLPWLKRIESLTGTAGASGPVKRSDAAEIFEFMLITIRGLSLERFMDKDAAYFEQHLSMLADFVSFRLQSLEPQLDQPQTEL